MDTQFLINTLEVNVRDLVRLEAARDALVMTFVWDSPDWAVTVQKLDAIIAALKRRIDDANPALAALAVERARMGGAANDNRRPTNALDICEMCGRDARYAHGPMCHVPNDAA